MANFTLSKQKTARSAVFLLTCALLLLQGCATTQLFETAADQHLGANNDNNYIFENDTLKIEYDFWQEAGMMNFRVTNKLNIPLYIDWRKSAFVWNDLKKPYWTETETVETTGSFSWGYRGWGGGSIHSVSVSKKPERIAFLPPGTSEVKSRYALINSAGLDLNKFKAQKTTQPSAAVPGKTVSVKTISFSRENSPIVFRNFLSLSTSEQFNREFYIDHSFYLIKATRMPRREFLGKRTTNKQGDEHFSLPYGDGRNFFTGGTAP